MSRLRVHVLYEYGVELHAYCSGHIRLLRPLAHPSVADSIALTSGRSFDGHHCDVVIVERLWRPDIDLDKAQRLIERVRDAGAKLVYSQDDDFGALYDSVDRPPWLSTMHMKVMDLFAREAKAILVSTEALKRKMSALNPHIFVIPNALDERLATAPPPRGGERGGLVIGYMGTRTHDEDLALIGPALRALLTKHPDVEVQVVGGVTRKLDFGTRVRTIDVPPSEADYPLFMLWFMSTRRWDIGLAPLRDNAFNACKSDIKFLDYGALGAASLFSDVPPYAAVASDQTGIVVDNDPAAWNEALERLVCDHPLRAEVSNRAYDVVHATRTLRRRAVDWRDALHQLL